MGADVFLRIHNGSSDPINKVRLRLAFGAGHHGPQLVGGIAPGATVTAIAYIPATSKPSSFTPSSARFIDASSQAWVLDAEGRLTEDDDVDKWIEEAVEFAKIPHSPEERGVFEGVELMPPPEAWRDGLSGLDWKVRDNPYPPTRY